MSLETVYKYSNKNAGKITILTLLAGILIFSAVSVGVYNQKVSQIADAQDTAQTSVTVLNRPPEWTVDPFEDPASSPTNPTNEGDTVTWKGTAFDPNGDNDYFLLICKTDNGAVPNQGGDGSPRCTEADGTTPDLDNQWGVSTSTPENTEAVVTYTTQDGQGEDEVNDWYAYICDNDDVNPRCNLDDVEQGSGDSGSPFYVNYAPTFTTFNAPSGTDPGDQAVWTTVASDPNTFTGPDHEVQLFVCRTDSFDEEAGECDGGVANTYATSTLTASNPSVTYTVDSPKPNGDYDAWGFVIDNFGLAASGGAHGTNEPLPVNNVAPTIASSSINLLNTDGSSDPLTVTVPEGETPGFQIEFVVADDNSCETMGGGDEIVSAIANVYRSGYQFDSLDPGQASCQTDDHFDANACYPNAVEPGTYGTVEGWEIECNQVAASCGGTGDDTVSWECTFPLWHVVDPTDGSTSDDVQFFDQEWLVSVQATDADSATSTLVESQNGNDVARLLTFNLQTSSIAYGELEPDDDTGTHPATTTIVATGNVGIDQDLAGTSMCGDFDAGQGSSSCPGDPSNTILPDNQSFAFSSGTSYGSGTFLNVGDSSFETAEINISKPTVPTVPTSGNIFWGLAVPDSITLAGNYFGENTFEAIQSNPSNW